MRAAVVQFPGSNCDRDLARAFDAVAGTGRTQFLWHKDVRLPDGLDVIGLPGGFSFGDYLRSGAMSARAPIMQAVREFAAKGGYVIGICNGFQILTEAGLLPGVLMRNRDLKFICKRVGLSIGTRQSVYTQGFAQGEAAACGIEMIVAHGDGNYKADAATLEALEAEERIAFRYLENPNGSDHGIAGILSANRRVLGMMPHPERSLEGAGATLFQGLMHGLVSA